MAQDSAPQSTQAQRSSLIHVNPPPPGWGDDELTTFFDLARGNAFSSYQDPNSGYLRMTGLDGVFSLALTELQDPENVVAAALAFRCHSALRAAAQLTLSGQVPEAYTVMRGALEYALYAHHAATDPDHALIWLNRHDDAEALRRSRGAFKPAAIFPELRVRDERIAHIASALYNQLIDYGAHPNPRGVLTTMEVQEGEGERTFSFTYLSAEGTPFRLAMKTWSQVAVSCLDILDLALPTSFGRSDVKARSLALRQGI